MSGSPSPAGTTPVAVERRIPTGPAPGRRSSADPVTLDPGATAPLVDVGIPAHGRPGYLAEAIESVLGQTLLAWRLVVSEDGPGGGEVETAVRPYLDDSRVRFVATGEPVGAAENMTRLIREGSAPYVALLHDDDRWRPAFLEHGIAFLDAHPECGFVFSGVAVIDESGRELRQAKALVPEGVQRVEEFVPLLLAGNVIPAVSVVARRSAYEAVGAAFDRRFARIYDYEMWLRLSLRRPVGFLARCDAEWRSHGAQSSIEGRLRGEEKLRFLEHAVALARLERPDLHLDDRLMRYARARVLLSNAVDAVELGQRRRSLAYLVQAARAFPPAVVDPHSLAVLVNLLTGGLGGRAIGSLRVWARRHGWARRLYANRAARGLHRRAMRSAARAGRPGRPDRSGRPSSRA